MLYSAMAIMRAGSGSAARQWRNTWELDTGAFDEGFSPTVAAVIADGLTAFHRKVLLEAYTLDRVVVGTYAPDNIISQDEFVVSQVNLPGLRFGSGAQLLGLESTLTVKREVAQGRSGRMWLRGLLHEGDVQGTSGGSLVLTTPETIMNTVGQAWGDLSTLLSAEAITPVMARGAWPLVNVRQVTNLVVGEPGNRHMRRAVRRGPTLPSSISTILDVIAGPGGDEVANVLIAAYNALPLGDVPLLP